MFFVVLLCLQCTCVYVFALYSQCLQQIKQPQWKRKRETEREKESKRERDRKNNEEYKKKIGSHVKRRRRPVYRCIFNRAQGFSMHIKIASNTVCNAHVFFFVFRLISFQLMLVICNCVYELFPYYILIWFGVMCVICYACRASRQIRGRNLSCRCDYIFFRSCNQLTDLQVLITFLFVQ